MSIRVLYSSLNYYFVYIYSSNSFVTRNIRRYHKIYGTTPNATNIPTTNKNNRQKETHPTTKSWGNMGNVSTIAAIKDNTNMRTPNILKIVNQLPLVLTQVWFAAHNLTSGGKIYAYNIIYYINEIYFLWVNNTIHNYLISRRGLNCDYKELTV